MFFSEEKNQKTFMSYAISPANSEMYVLPSR